MRMIKKGEKERESSGKDFKRKKNNLRVVGLVQAFVDLSVFRLLASDGIVGRPLIDQRFVEQLPKSLADLRQVRPQVIFKALKPFDTLLPIGNEWNYL